MGLFVFYERRGHVVGCGAPAVIPWWRYRPLIWYTYRRSPICAVVYWLQNNTRASYRLVTFCSSMPTVHGHADSA